MISKIKTSKKDYFWSYLAYVLKFGANLLVIPLVLNRLSTSEYGLWVTFLSLGMIVNLFDFGFSSTILRNMTYVWGGAQKLQAEGFSPNDTALKRNDWLFTLTFKTCKRIYLIIGCAALVLSFSLGLAYVDYIIRDMYKVEYLIAWLIYGVSISLNLYYAYWPIALKSVGAIQQSQKATIIGYVVQLAVSYVGVLLGGGILALSVAGCLCGLTIRFVSKIYFTRYQGIGAIIRTNQKTIKSAESREAFKILWVNAKKAGVSTVATVSMTQVTTLLCSAYLGVAVSGEYGICLQLLTALAGVAQIYYQATIPQLTQARQGNNSDESKKLFSVSSTIAWGIYICGFLALLILGKPLLSLIGSQTPLNIGMLVLISFYMFGEMNYSMSASFISLENTLPFVPSVVLTTILIIPLSFLSIKLSLGIWGLLGVRCLVESAYIFWKWPMVAHNQIGTNYFGMLKCGIRELKSIFLGLKSTHQ